jgi:hypothetical protein
MATTPVLLYPEKGPFMFKAALHVIQRHGVLAAMKLASYRLLQRVMLIDVTHFMLQNLADVPQVHQRSDVDCRFLSAVEVHEFALDPANDLPSNMLDRLEYGHDLCFGGIVDGRLACYCWFAFDSIEAEHNSSSGNPHSGIAVSFPDEYVFRYKGFTHPDFRGQQLYSLIAQESAAALRQRRVSFVLSTAEWTNFSALRSSYRSGFHYLGLVVVAEIAGRRFVRYPSMACEGIYFEDEAELLDRSLFCPFQTSTSDSIGSPRSQEGSLS